ncbi:hypothetical protein P691DRAFT_652774, partial [Macrolepiota fuliginosa MF-IS2]
FAGVRNFAMKLKLAIIQAHDNVIAAHIKQIRNMNGHCQWALFTNGDYVYISTQNMMLPKGLSRKLAPKYIGPYMV